MVSCRLRSPKCRILNITSKLIRSKNIGSYCIPLRTNDTLQIHVSDGPQTIPIIFQKAQSLNIQIQSVSMTGPTLDDVYISYTGHQIREQGPEPRRKRRW